MAPSAVDELPGQAELDDAISKPPPGMVLPPKDLRNIIEKTSGFIERNGQPFIERIRTKEGSNPKFSFLNPSDAYYPFFEWRLDEIRAGRGTSIAAGRAGEVPRKQPEKPKGPEPPAEFHFSARMPNISAVDLEVVKLTAMWVAKNGRTFMTNLSQREANNAQFDFLRPQHSMYQYYSRLVDQYKDLLAAGAENGGEREKARIAELKANVKDRFRILGRAKQRAEWTKHQESQKQKKEEQHEQEKLEYAQIDWQDFVVVETVVFTAEDEQDQLPPPTSINDLQSASLEQKAATRIDANRRLEEAFPGEDLAAYAYQQAPPVQLPHMPMMPVPPPQQMYSPQPPVPGPYAPPPGYPIQPQQAYPQQPPQNIPYKRAAPEDDEEAARIEERRLEQERAQAARAAASAAPGNVRIREAGTGLRGARAGRQRVQMAQCPQCKEMYPVDELNEHMRIELLDPEWRKQRAKAESRNATTNLSTQDVANNLRRLAQQRTDVFDPVTGKPQGQ